MLFLLESVTFVLNFVKMFFIMESLLKRYLKNYSYWEYIDIDYYNVDGAVCTVAFYTDESKYYKETLNINIWDMLVFYVELYERIK